MAGPRKTAALNLPAPYQDRSPATILAFTRPDPEERAATDAEQADWEVLYNHLESSLAALYTWRLAWWQTWGTIARYEKPYRYYPFITANMYNQGLRQDYAIVDRTPTLCGDICAAGLSSLLTDPDRDWLNLDAAIPGFEPDRAGKKYYADLTERLNYIYDHSNFYDAQAQIYDDLTFFGNGLCFDYDDDEEILHVRTPCLGEFFLGVDYNNNDETVFEECRQTVAQMVGMFGEDNLPEDVLAMWRMKGGALRREFVIGHAVEPNFGVAGPNGEGAYGQVQGGFTWREVWWMRGRKNTRPLAMHGFWDKPFENSRWKTQSNEAYGRGVGEDMLGDAIQLQMMTRQLAMAIEKVIDPPMGADVTLLNQPNSTKPGGITFMATGQGGEKKFWSLYEIKPDIDALSKNMAEVRERISRTAYNDVFQMLMQLRSQMKLKADLTATEVEQLTQEVLTRLGPMMGRVYGGMRRRVKRHIRIMERKGLMPPKPASLRGVPTKIGFTSLLTEARRAVKTQSIARTTQYIGELADSAWPEGRFLVNIEKAGRAFAAGVDAPVDMLNDHAEFQRLVAEAQKQQQGQQILENTLPQAKAAQALASTKMEPGSALSALAQPPGVA